MSLAQQKFLEAGKCFNDHARRVQTPGRVQHSRSKGAVAAENAAWIRSLTAIGSERDAAVARLYRVLLKFGFTEARRRGARQRLSGPELEDLAHQAAADATLTVCRKVKTFRGECRFTTWAYRFVAFDVSSKISRHPWQRRGTVNLDDYEWDLLPAKPALAPEEQAEARDVLRTVLRVCADELTERQRTVFEAVVVRGVPVGELAGQLGSTPNALHKTMFDARRKLRGALVEAGHLQGSSRV